MKRITEPKKKVLFAGNPNVGKSTLFNALTGLRQHTGNWAGKTVDIAYGMLRPEKEVELVDLPGMYSLYGTSLDEQVAADCLMSDMGDCVVVVCDGCCLERNLILALQIMGLRDHVILCVNLMDEARLRGISIHQKRLQQELGIPVVFTSGAKKSGLRELREQIHLELIRTEKKCLHTDDPVKMAKELCGQCITGNASVHENWRLILDQLLVSRRHGYGILLALLLLIIWLTVWGANYPSTLLGQLFGWIFQRLEFLRAILPNWLSGILLDGVYTTCTEVISVMLPPLLIFFPMFTVLEDIGYLPRLAFLMERGMRRCGGCGKQALTMCMGLGCNAVGVTGCRIITSPKQRLVAILTNAMIPCNGRFPSLILLGTLFFGDALGATAVAGCVVLGVFGVMICTGLLSSVTWRHYPREDTFFMEIPPIRSPQLKTILIRSLWDRTLHVAGRALLVAAPAGAILWLLEDTGSLQAISGWLNPVGEVLGMNGPILTSFLLSFPANELFLPTLLTVLNGSSEAMLTSLGINWKMAVCMMVFIVFHWPCATTLLTVRKETGSIKKTAAAALLPTAVGVILCLMLNLLL